MFKKYAHPDGANRYEILPLVFVTPNILETPLHTRNIICVGESRGVEEKFYVTLSYNDEDSIFVQREHNDGNLLLDVYMKNIPILMNTSNRPPFSAAKFLKQQMTGSSASTNEILGLV